MSVAVVGVSESWLSLGGGFSDSGMIPLRFIDEWKFRTALNVLPLIVEATEALAMTPLMGNWARRGVRDARRSASCPALEKDFITDNVLC